MVTTPEAHAAPLRTCVGCRSKRPQHDLVRIADSPSGVQVARSAPGRGAWVCSGQCLQLAVRRKAFDRAWRRTVRTEEVTALQNAFTAVITNMEELPAAGRTGTGGPTKG
ncbi:MAG: hypothetical protein RI900_2303 [Actinomycetota bacterium]